MDALFEPMRMIAGETALDAGASSSCCLEPAGSARTCG
jgi:hypothetical protein